MRVIVCGGRHYSDEFALMQFMDSFHAETPITLAIEGGASGADALVRKWATSRDVPKVRFDAEWKKYGRKAGPIRNQLMLDEHPDAVIAFPGGAGTNDMVVRAMRTGVRVIFAS